jgi:hypothetical protein
LRARGQGRRRRSGVREFSVPASVRVDDVDTLSTTVFALADV